MLSSALIASGPMILIALVCGVLLGAFVVWLAARRNLNLLVAQAVEREAALATGIDEKSQLRTDLARAQEQVANAASLRQDLRIATEHIRNSQEEIAGLRENLGALHSSVRSLQLRSSELESEIRELKIERDGLLRQRQVADRALSEASANLENERSQASEKLALLLGARQQLSDQFKSLAGEILEEKSERFTRQNQENIGQLLNPLREKISEFQTRVEQVQSEGIAGRSELRVQLDNLKDLNERLSQDAANLVSALKGSSKVQGDWGEFILEGLLEASGLRKGHEYRVQESFKREDGKGARLDVVVNLPGGRHLVIDSKVSLGDYTEYCNGEAEIATNAALARHLVSVRTHLKQLSERNYQALYGLSSLDFVVMFVPIEPAFMLALARDPRLWNDAWDKNVLLVSPSTLLFVIRTVAQLWRQEHQTRNVKEIARRGAELYDKFVGFVEDLANVGNRLSQARDAFDAAYGKLRTGRGNLIQQADLLRKLGVKPKKGLPFELIAVADELDFDPTFNLSATATSSETEEELDT